MSLHQIFAFAERWGLNLGYMAKVIEGKFGSKAVDDLTPFEWEQLLYTANNRGKAIDERNDGTWDGAAATESSATPYAVPAMQSPYKQTGPTRIGPCMIPVAPINHPHEQHSIPGPSLY